MLPLPAMGFWLGEGGMARPSRGVRAPPFEPGMGGRRRGTGEDMAMVVWRSSALLYGALRTTKSLALRV